MQKAMHTHAHTSKRARARKNTTHRCKCADTLHADIKSHTTTELHTHTHDHIDRHKCLHPRTHMHAGAGTGAGAVHHAIHATCPELACLGALCWQHLFFHRGCQPAHVCPLVFMRLHACRLVLLEDASFNLVEMASNALQLLILAEPDAYIALAKQLVQQVNCYVQMCLPELMIKHASPMPLWMAASI